MRKYAAVFALFLAACGSDATSEEPITINNNGTSNNAATNNAATNNAATNNAATNNAATNNATTNNTTNNAPPDGAELFRIYCSVCHGAEGVGGTVWPGSIQGYEPIHDIVKNGRGTMAPVAVTDAESDAIQEYLNSFGVDVTALSGVETYANQCASCHGPEGQGTDKGPIIQFTFPAYGKWVTRNGREGIGYPGPMTAYPTTRVTDVQLDEIVDFLHAQTRPTSGQDLHDTFCGNCHGVDGANGPAASSLGGFGSSLSDVRRGHGGTNYGSRRNYMPAWSTTELTNSEVIAIDVYRTGI